MRYAIGGVPTSGKSTLAKRIAQSKNIPYISTDLIKEYTINTLGREKYFESLNNDTNLTVDEYLGKNSVEEIVRREKGKNELLAKHISQWFKVDWDWEDYVIEGVGIQPESIQKDKEQLDLTVIFLVYTEKDLIKERIFSRGLWDSPSKYSDEYKYKEIEWVWQYNNYLNEYATKFGLGIIYVNHENELERALELLKIVKV